VQKKRSQPRWGTNAVFRRRCESWAPDHPPYARVRDMTVDAVCAEANLSKGAFYGYFNQKRDLLLALFEDDAHHLYERRGSGPPRLKRSCLTVLARATADISVARSRERLTVLARAFCRLTPHAEDLPD
jgi:AcrR family transcriptional regulator